MTRRGAVELIVVLVVLLCFAVSVPAYWPYVNDDAFISFRYATNLLAGGGLVFNPGEYVEGYTNFAWVLLSAGLLWVGEPENILTLAKSVGVAFAVGTILLTYLNARRSSDHWLVRAFPPLLLALNPGFAANAVSGLETALFGFLLALALFVRLGPSPRDVAFGVTMALATLTRPEGAFVFAVLVLFQWVEGIAWQRIGRVVGGFSAFVGPYLAWKWTYYGSLLPNTYYAKPGTPWNGLGYALRFTVEGGYTQFLGLPLLALAAGVLVTLHRGRPTLAFGVALGSAAVLTGGDWMIGWRFWVPVLPIAFLIMVEPFDRVLAFGWDRRWALTAMIIPCMLIAWALAGPRQALAGQCRDRGDGQREAHLVIARWIGNHARPGGSVALSDVGMVGYYTGIRTVDISGLTDAFIGHSPGRMLTKVYDPAYVFSRHPDFIVLVGNRAPEVPKDNGGWIFDLNSLWFQDRRLASHPDFVNQYRYEFSRYASFEGYLHLFRRAGGAEPILSPIMVR